MLSPVRKAIESIAADVWTPIKYTNAIWDQDAQMWISDAEVAEVAFTAFTSLAKRKQASARLIVRRVPDMNPAHQSGLFTVYRYHAVFTNSPLPMLQAEKAHRAHAIVEQVIADLKNGPLAHLPSGSFWANSAWLVCAAMAFNLTRAAGALASVFHAKATTGTIRAQLINVPGRLAHSARKTTLHLPTICALADGLGADGRRSSDHPPSPDASTTSARTNRNITWRPPARPVRQARPQPVRPAASRSIPQQMG